MLAPQVVAAVSSVFGLFTTLVGLSVGAYKFFKASKIKLNTLSERMDTLKSLIESLKQKLNGIDVLSGDPSGWIKKAVQFASGVDIQALNKAINADCINELVPNCWDRWGARASIDEKIQEIDELILRGKETLKEIKVKGSRQKPVVSIVGEARKKLRQEIWEQVTIPGKAEIICIHGLGGVGKTAMAASIHNQALEELKDLENVVWLKLEHKWEISQVQEEIARKLSIDLDGATNNEARARKLQRDLKGKGNILMVLDSVCHDFTLGDIGLSERIGACKLILTSRSASVCRSITAGFRKKVYEMKRLSDENEAWELFKDEVGPDKIQCLGKETCKMAEEAVVHLHRFPKAISLLAAILMETHDNHASGNDFKDAWSKQLLLLSRSLDLLGEKSKELVDCFKESIEGVGELSLKCFVYCALFPKGHVIKAEELIDYWMWEGLLAPILSLSNSRKEGRKVLERLEDAHLLDIGKEDSIKMTNLVLNVAMYAADFRGYKLFVRSGKFLSDLPLAKDWPPNTERASFMQCQLREVRNNPSGVKLSTLLLQGNPKLNHIHNNFFYKIHNLKVLDLSNSIIERLPYLSGLRNLQALLLRSCANLKQIPSLAYNQKLIVIDLSKTPLEQLPHGLNKLTDLRRLDLSHTEIEVFPAGMFDKLTSLEELLLIKCANLKHLPSLANLQKLTVIELSGSPLEQLPEGLCRLTELRRLDFSHTKVEVFPAEAIGPMTQLQQLLLINCENLIHVPSLANLQKLIEIDLSRSPIEKLPEGLHQLTDLRRLNLSYTMIEDFSAEVLGQLKQLEQLLLINCVNFKRLPSLANLQKLIVINLSGSCLEEVPQGLHLLTDLRRLDLSHTKIEVFPAGVVGKLTQLEELLLITDHNGGCMWGSSQSHQIQAGPCVEELADLSSLNVLQLTCRNKAVFNKFVVLTEEQHISVPRSFKFAVGGSCAGMNTGDNSITVVGDCRKIKLLKGTAELYLMECHKKIDSLKFVGCLQDLTVLDVSDFQNLTHLLTLEMLGSLKQLKKICVKRCYKMVSIIKINAEDHSTSVTPKMLATLVLYDLPRLESICQTEELECPALCQVYVWQCNTLKLLETLPRKGAGVIAINGEKEKLLQEEEDGETLELGFIFRETSVPEELSSTLRIRRQDSAAERTSQTQNRSGIMGFTRFLLPSNWTGTARSNARKGRDGYASD